MAKRSKGPRKPRVRAVITPVRAVGVRAVRPPDVRVIHHVHHYPQGRPGVAAPLARPVAPVVRPPVGLGGPVVPRPPIGGAPVGPPAGPFTVPQPPMGGPRAPLPGAMGPFGPRRGPFGG